MPHPKRARETRVGVKGTHREVFLGWRKIAITLIEPGSAAFGTRTCENKSASWYYRLLTTTDNHQYDSAQVRANGLR